MQIGGRNYLLPVDARLERGYEVPDEAVDLDLMMRAMEEREPALNLVVLDCCRDNPFGRSWRGGRSAAAAGLTMPKDAPSGTFIAFATSPDKTAADGDGEHSPYTAALLECLPVPGREPELAFKEVGARVVAATAQRQEPWYNSKFYGSFQFVPAAVAPLLPRSQTGGLRVTTEPVGAEVVLGDRWYGSSPATFTDVPAGDYQMVVQMEGYEAHTGEVAVRVGQLTNADKIVLRPKRHPPQLGPTPAQAQRQPESAPTREISPVPTTAPTKRVPTDDAWTRTVYCGRCGGWHVWPPELAQLPQVYCAECGAVHPEDHHPTCGKMIFCGNCGSMHVEGRCPRRTRP